MTTNTARYSDKRVAVSRVRIVERAGLKYLVPIALLLLASCPIRPQQEDPPNIVILLVDALRRDHLGLYGYDQPTSPYLDQLAESSVVFEHAYAHSSATFASTTSLLTSMHFPVSLKVDLLPEQREALGSLFRQRRSLSVLVPTAPTFPQMLAQERYSTLAILTNPHHHKASGFPDHFSDTRMLLEGNRDPGKTPYVDGLEVNKSYFRWLAGKDCERPFLAYLHYMDVHSPYDPPKEFRKLFVTASGKNKYQNAIPTGTGIPTETDLLFMQQLYDAQIRYVDSLIRQVHERTLGHCQRRTVLVVTSDHGDEFMDHGGLGHGRTLEKELIWIPLLIHGLKDVAANRYPHVMGQVDLGPTLLAASGVGPNEPPADWDGRNLLPSLRTGEPMDHWASVSRYGPLIGLPTRDWHAVWKARSGELTHLYDQHRDPLGLSNLARSGGQNTGDLTAFLRPALARRQAAIVHGNELRALGRAEGLVTQPEAEVVEQLRALGYLQ